MKSILENMKTGEVQTYDIPAPELRAGGLLVRTEFSAISAGTERVKVETGEKSLLQKALARPDLVKQVIDYGRHNGIQAAIQKVRARLDTLNTLGYSCAGTVLQVGEGVTGFRPGDRVACAGANYATHSEINFVPQHLASHVPASVSLDAASLATIGAIAMQGLRQAKISFGETVAVIGAGLVGILAIQMARAAGCRVIAIDRNASRAKQAAEMGAHLGLSSEDAGLLPAVQAFSRYGVDAAIITAATSSAEPVELAASLLRDRGRIVIVGDVGMSVSRQNMYMKELSLLMSRSYGPGRYDAQYEEAGNDYPIGYVRWTEQRNLEAFLDLLATGAIDVSGLLRHRYPVQFGAKAYDEIRSGGAYTAIIEYAAQRETAAAAEVLQPQPQRNSGALRIGLIGAGSFGRSVIVPNLKAAGNASLHSVASLSGVGAESARQACGFSRAATPADLLNSPEVDAVFIASRHDSHAAYVQVALEHDKPVFVEKPLAITRKQLASIRDTYNAARLPFLMVGFNRRFAPATGKIREFFAARREPMMVQVRVNAGFLPPEHWAHADGGRIVGELCHFVDWARAMVGVPIRYVSASSLPDGARYRQDNVAVTLAFSDGSIGNLVYLANGDRSVPKEYFEVSCEGKTARLDNWASLRLAVQGRERTVKAGRDKGHRREIELTIKAMRAGLSPIAFDEIVEVTETCFAIVDSIRTQRSIEVNVLGDALNVAADTTAQGAEAPCTVDDGVGVHAGLTE